MGPSSKLAVLKFNRARLPHIQVFVFPILALALNTIKSVGWHSVVNGTKNAPLKSKAYQHKDFLIVRQRCWFAF